MRSRSRQPSTLSIRPPSPNNQLPGPATPIHQNLQVFPPDRPLISPRKAPLPPSPTQSSVSGVSSTYAYDERRPRGSSDVSRGGGYELGPPPVPVKNDKKLPAPPPFPGTSGGPPSPHRKDGQGKGWAVGMYDNKLVSSTLSHLPPLPSLSPALPNSSSSLSSLSATPMNNASLRLPPSATTTTYPTPSITPRPSLSSSSSGVFFPDSTASSTSVPEPGHIDRALDLGSTARGVKEAIAHSRPDSPWSILMIHVLPIFAGSPLKSSIEELNLLCHQHIVATSQRAPPSRLVAVLTSDFTDFIGSGMMTLKSKMETLEDGKIVQRLAEIWSFFWAQNLPYLEGIFLPLTQLRDLSSTSSTYQKAGTSTSTQSTLSPIAVRHLLLSGFLLHILLPVISRLIPLITLAESSSHIEHLPPPTTSDLQRLLQMALVLSTQAKYSSFFPLRESTDSLQRDEEVRDSVETLGKATRWRINENALQVEQSARDAANPSSQTATPQRQSLALQRGPSMSQNGRYRRKGWRASSSTMGQVNSTQARKDSEVFQPHRQNSDYLQAPDQRWGRPRVDEEDEDESENTPGQKYVPGKASNIGLGLGVGGLRSEESSYATTTTTGSTLTAGTVRAPESLATTYTSSDQHTPLAEFGSRIRPVRGDSSGSNVLTPVVQDIRRTGRTQI